MSSDLHTKEEFKFADEGEFFSSFPSLTTEVVLPAVVVEETKAKETKNDVLLTQLMKAVKDKPFNAAAFHTLLVPAGESKDGGDVAAHKLPNIDEEDATGKTALIHAAESGNLAALEALIAEGAQPDVEDLMGMTALSYACKEGHLDIVEYLLTLNKLASAHQGAAGRQAAPSKAIIDINHEDESGCTPLAWAAFNGDLAIVKALIAARAKPDLASGVGFTPLMAAAAKVHVEIVSYLLSLNEEGKEPQVNVKRKGGPNGLSVVGIAVLSPESTEVSKVAVLKELHTAGAQSDAGERYQGMSLLHHVANQQSAQTALFGELLQDKGQQKNLDERTFFSEKPTSPGYTPLAYVAKHGDLQSVQLLIKEFKVDPNQYSMLLVYRYEKKPLLEAYANGYTEIVEYLLKLEKDGKHVVNRNQYDGNGNTLLILAAAKGDLTLVDRLISEGADATRANNAGQTPLMAAAAGGDLAVVKALLKIKGTDAIRANDAGQTALMLAAAGGHLDVVKELLKLPKVNANVDVADKQKNTALAHAVMGGHKAVVSELLDPQYSADVNHPNAAGETPLICAAHAGKVEMVRFLIRDGFANPTPQDRDGRNALMVAVARYTQLSAVGEAEVAAREQQLAVVEYLLEVPGICKHAEVLLAQDKKGATLLPDLAASGNVELLQKFYGVLRAQLNAKPNAALGERLRTQSEQAFLQAAQTGHAGIVDHFLKLKEPSHPTLIRALKSAAYWGQLEIFTRIHTLLSGRDVSLNMRVTPQEWQDIFFQAAAGGRRLDVVQAIYDLMGDSKPNDKTLRNSFNRVVATRGAHVEVVQYLYNLMDGKQKSDRPALMEALINAAGRGNTETVEYLLDLLTKNQTEPLCVEAATRAALNGPYPAVVRCLVERGVIPGRSDKSYRGSSLLRDCVAQRFEVPAQKQAQQECIRILTAVMSTKQMEFAPEVPFGFLEVNHPHTTTALELLITNKQLDLAKSLLKKGAVAPFNTYELVKTYEFSLDQALEVVLRDPNHRRLDILNLIIRGTSFIKFNGGVTGVFDKVSPVAIRNYLREHCQNEPGFQECIDSLEERFPETPGFFSGLFSSKPKEQDVTVGQVNQAEVERVADPEGDVAWGDEEAEAQVDPSEDKDDWEEGSVPESQSGNASKLDALISAIANNKTSDAKKEIEKLSVAELSMPVLVAGETTTVLHYAHALGRKHIVALLFQKGIIFHQDDITAIKAYCDPKVKALFMAIQRNNVAAAKEEIKKLSEQDLSVELDAQGRTALIYAASLGRTEIVEKLVRKGVMLRAVNREGDTAFVCAMKAGHLDCAFLLLKSHLNLNAQVMDGKTALMMAVEKGHLGFAQALVLKGADLNLQDKAGKTIVMIALEKGYLDFAEFAVMNGIKLNLNLRDKSGKTALDTAIDTNNLKNVLWLLQTGKTARISVVDKSNVMQLYAFLSENKAQPGVQRYLTELDPVMQAAKAAAQKPTASGGWFASLWGKSGSAKPPTAATPAPIAKTQVVAPPSLGSSE